MHADGLVSAQQVAEAIRDDTCLVTIMFANNEIGRVHVQKRYLKALLFQPLQEMCIRDSA